jgi:type 1 glutamine amidotransferase
VQQPISSGEKHTLILQGGWLGHQPEEVAHIFAEALQWYGFSVTLAHTLDALLDVREVEQASLIIPIYTMSTIT